MGENNTPTALKGCGVKITLRTNTMMLHTYMPKSMALENMNTLRFLRYSPDKILKVNVTTARSKVKSRSHHDTAHRYHNQSFYQVPAFYTLRFPRYSPYKTLKVKVNFASLMVKSRSHHDVAHLYPPHQCLYQVSTFYTLRFLR